MKNTEMNPDHAAEAGLSSAEAYIVAAGSTPADLIAHLVPNDVERLWEASAERHTVATDLNGKFSAQAESLHLKKVRQGRIEPEEWKPEEELRQFYRIARSNGRRKVVSAFRTAEQPIILEIFEKVRVHLESVKTEVTEAEKGFFADYGVERPSSLTDPLDRHIKTFERAENSLRAGSYHDIQSVVGEFFGSDFQAGRRGDEPLEEAQ